MGVLFDYFRASDSDAVMQACAVTGGKSPLLEGQFPGLELKGIDGSVILGQLVAFIRGVEWDTDLVGSTTVYPSAETMPPDNAAWATLDEDSPWATGPWVIELAVDIRDTLAAVPAEDIPALGVRWSQIDEFGNSIEGGYCAGLVQEIVAFARDAVSHDEMLYVWCSL
jgi:hypothetical protein